MRLGLCCIFVEQPIKFRTTTVTSIAKMDRRDAINKISGLCLDNAKSLTEAIKYCHENGIGCYRIGSRMWPVKTHDTVGYELSDLPDHQEIIFNLQKAGEYAKQNNVRLVFHPDQFVVLNSNSPQVIESSIKEIEYHADVAELVGADVINIHGGNSKPDKKSALDSFAMTFNKLSMRARKMLTVENDDITYTPEDLLPLCDNLAIPLVYDIHHHRCNQDRFSCEEASELAVKTWNREPLFHLSSPISAYGQKNARAHHDFIDVNDFPSFWFDKSITVEVEAKAKENAISKLKADFVKMGIRIY